MHAYAYDGSKIVATKELIPGTCSVQEGGFLKKPDGTLDFHYSGGTEIDYNGQNTVVEYGQQILVDEGDCEWPACAVILLAKPIDEDETLPVDLVSEATAAHEAWLEASKAEQTKEPSLPWDVTYTISVPQSGWRQRNSFTPEEKALLRPIAETLAMLDGNAFFGMSTDENGDDIHYENYLPEAAALAEANGGWSSLASFVRGNTPLPENPMGLEIETPGRVDLASGDLVTVEVSDIEWDLSESSDEDVNPDLQPLLPTSLTVGVPQNWHEETNLADLIADRYGYCIIGIGSSKQIDP